MRKIFIFAAFFILSALFGNPDTSSPSFQNPQPWEWKPAAAFGGPPTWFSAAFTIGDKAYVGTGYGAKNEFWQYRDFWWAEPQADIR